MLFLVYMHIYFKWSFVIASWIFLVAFFYFYFRVFLAFAVSEKFFVLMLKVWLVFYYKSNSLLFIHLNFSVTLSTFAPKLFIKLKFLLFTIFDACPNLKILRFDGQYKTQYWTYLNFSCFNHHFFTCLLSEDEFQKFVQKPFFKVSSWFVRLENFVTTFSVNCCGIL